MLPKSWLCLRTGPGQFELNANGIFKAVEPKVLPTLRAYLQKSQLIQNNSTNVLQKHVLLPTLLICLLYNFFSYTSTYLNQL